MRYLKWVVLCLVLVLNSSTWAAESPIISPKLDPALKEKPNSPKNLQFPPVCVAEIVQFSVHESINDVQKAIALQNFHRPHYPGLVPLSALNGRHADEVTPVDLKVGLERLFLDELSRGPRDQMQSAFQNSGKHWVLAYEQLLKRQDEVMKKDRHQLFLRQKDLLTQIEQNPSDVESLKTELSTVVDQIDRISVPYTDYIPQTSLAKLYPQDAVAIVKGPFKKEIESKLEKNPNGRIEINPVTFDIQLARRVTKNIAEEYARLTWDSVRTGIIPEIIKNYEEYPGPVSWTPHFAGEDSLIPQSIKAMKQKLAELMPLRDLKNYDDDDAHRALNHAYHTGFDLDESSFRAQVDDTTKEVYLNLPQGLGRVRYIDALGTSVLEPSGKKGMLSKPSPFLIVFSHGSGTNMSHFGSFKGIVGPLSNDGFNVISLGRPQSAPFPTVTLDYDPNPRTRAANSILTTRYLRKQMKAAGIRTSVIIDWGRSCGGFNCAVNVFYGEIQHQQLEGADAEGLDTPDIYNAQAMNAFDNGPEENAHIQSLVEKGVIKRKLYWPVLDKESAQGLELLGHFEGIVSERPHLLLQVGQGMVNTMGENDNNYYFDPRYVQKLMIMNDRFWPLGSMQIYSDPLLKYPFLNDPTDPDFIRFDDQKREGGHFLLSEQPNMSRKTFIEQAEKDNLDLDGETSLTARQRELLESVALEDIPKAYDTKVVMLGDIALRADELEEFDVVKSSQSVAKAERLAIAREVENQIKNTNRNATFFELFLMKQKIGMDEITAKEWAPPRSLLGRLQRLYDQSRTRRIRLLKVKAKGAPWTPPPDEWKRAWYFNESEWKWKPYEGDISTMYFDWVEKNWKPKATRWSAGSNALNR